MPRRIAGLLATVVLLAAAVFYVLAWRILPERRAREDAAARAAGLARHREAQRAQGPPAAALSVPAAPGADTAASPAGAAASRPEAAAVPASPYWTAFRGPRRDGHYRERPVMTNWPRAGLKPLWKQPVGGGHASFVSAGRRAFTIEQRGTQEVVAAYDVRTGHELWTHGWDARFDEHYGGEGPRATPAWHDGRVFALGAAGELRALDESTGRMIWRTNILADAGASNLEWGMAASPLVAGDTLVVVPGGPGGQSVVAYDLATGRREWSALDDRAAYSSPMLVTLGGVPQILVFTATRLAAVTPDRGELLWEFPWPTQSGINVSQPLVIGSDRVFISTGYGMGAVMIHVSRQNGSFTAAEVWRTNRMKNQFTSSVYHQGFIFGLDESILACIDAATGALKWKGGRYGYGQVMLADGHLVVITEDGDLALVRATPDRHEELARFPALSGRSWSHPAIADGVLLIRNVNEMAGFDLRVR